MPRAEPLQLKAAACQTFAGNIPGKPWRPIARTSNYYYYYPAHAQRMRRSVTDIYNIYTHRESLVRNHEPCAKALGNYVCHASAHALRMCKIIIITCTCNGPPWFSWYTAKVWHAAAFSCNLREASALMRISSNI